MLHVLIAASWKFASWTLPAQLQLATSYGQPAGTLCQFLCRNILIYIRGYHAYEDVWQRSLGEILLLQREPTNTKDSLAISVMKINNIVDLVPANLSALFFLIFFVERAIKVLLKLLGPESIVVQATGWRYRATIIRSLRSCGIHRTL